MLDPIDGTKSFICGLPLGARSSGCRIAGAPCYGLMNQPFTRERFFGDGEAAYWRGPARGAGSARGALENRKLHARMPVAVAGDAHDDVAAADRPSLRDNFHRVERAVRLSRYGGDCYAYCALAAGHVDLVIETNLKPYDIVALIPIIEGAGGVVTTWSGGAAAQGGAIVAAGDTALHEAALKLLGG